jgi:NADH pyrophosphatase NudC (nudix superfamily)
VFELTKMFDYARLEKWSHDDEVANFESYEDDDWFWQELELETGFQDVLKGPERAELEDVCDLVPVRQNSACGICGEADWVMREIRVCGHEFCADCLGAQLETQHECRYKCSLCRAESFLECAA